jgi:hypothetical protein
MAFHPEFGVSGLPGERSVYISYIIDNPDPVFP